MVTEGQPSLEPDAYQHALRTAPVGLVVYDWDLRIVLAEGDLLRSAGYAPEALRGRRVTEVLSADTFSLLESRYQDGLAGIEEDLDYRSPVDGRLYCTRFRALRNDAGAVVAAALLVWDVSERGRLAAQMEQCRSLLSLGCATYQRDSGWSVEPELLEIWGVTGNVTPEQVITELIVEGDRLRAERTWTHAQRTGRSIGLEYTIQHGRTGELRHLHGTVQASLGQDGLLLHAATTHVDVTDVVRTRERAQEVDAVSRRHRDLLMRQVSALLATSAGSLTQTLQATAELATTAVGDGCVIRTVSGDHSSVVAIAHRTDQGRAQLLDWARSPTTDLWSTNPVLARAVETGAAIHGVIGEDDLGPPQWSWGTQEIVAPAFHQGVLHGTIELFRDGEATPFDDADLDLLNVLADRMATLLEAERAGAWGQQLVAQLEQVNADQRQLVLQLDSIESRERGLLADAVHDEPLQLAVASLLRLDGYRTQLPEADPGYAVIGSIAGMLESCVDQLRNLMMTLTPPDLSSGLGPVLERLAESVFLGTDVQLRRRGPDHVHLDQDTKETVYRIVREGLINARKHAQATTVTIDLTEDDDVVTLSLTDDGIGLPADPDGAGTAFGHLGMSSMRARAAATDGRLVIGSRVGGGTQLELLVPTRRARARGATDADRSHRPRQTALPLLPHAQQDDTPERGEQG